MKPLLTLLLALQLSAVSQASLTLSTNGQTDYTIAISPDAPATEQAAAKELQTYLNQVTGADFKIQSTADLASAAPAILIQPPAGPPDSIHIRTDGNRLLLQGGGTRGTLYAVDSFLEGSVGVRWWTSGESTIPHTPTLTLPDLDQSHTPRFLYRECFNADVQGSSSAFAARLKMDGQHQTIPANLGGHYTLLGWCHTSFKLMPPSTYFAKHPEWYSQINGRRDYHWGQLCWSDPALQKELASIAKDPTAGIISVSQEDCFNPCQCDRCKAIEKEDGSPSGPLLRGVNAVAAEVAKQYPDFLVETLAYQWSRKPPKVTRPAKNVLVRLCSIEADFAHPLAAQSFGTDLKQWSSITDHLFVWNYVTNFSNYLIPDPNLTSIGPDLKFFADNHVIGVFEQGDDFNYPIGDFLPLRVWVQAHLLWNPSLDQHALTQEFLQGYYGPAAKPLGDYLDLINTAGAKGSWGCYQPEPTFLSAADLTQANKLFADAEASVADQPTYARRVHTQRLILDNVNLLRYDFTGQLKTRPEAVVIKDFDTAARQFINDAKKSGANSFSEGGSFDAYANTLRSTPLRNIPPKFPKFGTTLPANSYDIQQDQFYLFQLGTYTHIQPDPKASDGKAAVMSGAGVDWAIQFHIPNNAPYLGKGPWHCYIVARADAKTKTGGAFTIGMQDLKTGPVFTHRPVGLDTAGDGDYHTYGFILDELKPDQYFWIAPPGNANVTKIYVDRIFIQKM